MERIVGDKMAGEGLPTPDAESQNSITVRPEADQSRMIHPNILDHLLSSPVAKPVINTSGPNSR